MKKRLKKLKMSEKIIINELFFEEMHVNCICQKIEAQNMSTLIAMYQGTFKKIEEIKVGDLLMGDDYNPRNVLSVCKNEAEMYKINQSDGTDYTASRSHILVLKNKKGEIIEKSISNILKNPIILQEYQGYKINPCTLTLASFCAIKIKYIGKGEYFGFQIDGNNRFLLSDYTVTHTTLP
jgi:hypothetical protein